jgi:hypothetical protein
MTPPTDLSDDQLETELHLLAILLERHKNLILILGDNEHCDCMEFSVGEINDFSPELHKSIVIHLAG